MAKGATAQVKFCQRFCRGGFKLILLGGAGMLYHAAKQKEHFVATNWSANWLFYAVMAGGLALAVVGVIGLVRVGQSTDH